MPEVDKVAIKITELSTDRPIVDQAGNQTQQTRLYFKTITDQALIIGDGSPEGIVQAVEGATYQDRLGITGSIRYAKMVDDVGGDKKLGWVLI